METSKLREFNFFQKIYNQCVKTLVNWLTPDRLKVYPASIPILMIIAWVVSQFIGPGLTDISGTIIGSDFLAFYTGGRFYLNDRMNELYDFKAQYFFQERILGPSEYTYMYNYPPFTAVFYSLFSRHSYLTGLIIWWIFGLLLLFLSVLILRLELKSLKVYSTIYLFLTCFLFFPADAWFMYGQNSSISLFLYIVFFVMLRRKNDLVAGVTLGLLLYKPPLAIALSLMLLVKWRWRALIGGLVGVCFWLVIGFSTSPVAMRNYLSVIPRLTNIFRFTYFKAGINSFFGFSSLLLDNIWRKGADILSMFLLVCGCVTVVLMWVYRKWEPGSRKWDMMMSGTFALGLLISPQLFLYDLMLLLLPLAIVWSYYVGGTNNRPLDGGPLLFWSALLYIICLCGSQISSVQLKLCSLIGIPQFAIQFSIFVIIGWIYVVVNDKAISKKADS